MAHGRDRSTSSRHNVGIGWQAIHSAQLVNNRNSNIELFSIGLTVLPTGAPKFSPRGTPESLGRNDGIEDAPQVANL